MIKINASFTKKVPGDEPYSSDGVHLGVEVELPDRFLSDQEQFSTAVRKLFAQARAEVEEQVTGAAAVREPESVSNGVGHRRVDPRRNGHRRELASKKQLDFLLSLARRNGNIGPQQLADEAGVERLSDITKAQASLLIDRFSEPAR